MQAPFRFSTDIGAGLPDLPGAQGLSRAAPRLNRCTASQVRLLIVADGYHYLGEPYGLDFSQQPSGLSQFVASLLRIPGPARFEIDLAHLDQRAGASMMDFDSRIRRRIPGFAFDDPAQFSAEDFDVLFLFGCIEKLARDDASGQRRLAANGAPYPVGRLAETEIAVIEAFQKGGGGIFLAGDAGRAGSLLGEDLPRAAQMRRGTARPQDAGLSQTGLQQTGPVPHIEPPRPADTSSGTNAAGPIPAEPDQATPSGESAEFPAALDGGPRPLPIRVRAGPPGATGLWAYDGHRAGIGRTLTAVTWRPFLNGALQEFCAAPPPEGIEDGPDAATRRSIDARCAALALWLARPGTAQRSPSGG